MKSSKRAQYLSVAGAILNAAGFIVCIIIGAVAGILPVTFLGWQVLGGVLIWLYLAVYFRNKVLADQEKLDAASLTKTQEHTIFQGSEQREALFNVAQKRFKTFNKWGTLVFAALISIYNIFIGFWLLKGSSNVSEIEITSPLAGACAMIVFAFFSFLISRYATGMSVEADWKPLKCGGSYLLVSSLLSFIIAVGLALRFFQFTIIVNVMAYAVPIAVLIYGFETVLNTVLDVYRPRIEGQYHRVGFDSRLFGIINEPGNILHTAASTIDYQFGFKVSQTWFYKLLEKAVMPLLLFLLLCAYISTCFLQVDTGEQAVIERFGSTAGGERVLNSGLHFKWPWPIDIANIHQTQKIQQINIGFNADEEELFDEEGNPVKKPLLWGERHYETEHRLLVATEGDSEEIEQGAVPVSLIIAAVPVQYKVENVYNFLYKHTEPEKTLSDIAYREVARYMASAKLEPDIFGGEASESQSVLGAGREAASDELQRRIQQSADELDMGIRIVMVGLEGIHPPLEVAPDYERVIGAIQQKQRSVLSALAEQNKILTELGGSISQVDRLYELALKYQEEKASFSEIEDEQMVEDIDTAFKEASGEIFKKLSEAKSYAYDRTTTAEATGKRFASQLQAYNAAPQIYKQNMRLTTLEETLSDIRKYVIVPDEEDSEVVIIDLKEALTPSLYDIEVPE